MNLFNLKIPSYKTNIRKCTMLYEKEFLWKTRRTWKKKEYLLKIRYRQYGTITHDMIWNLLEKYFYIIIFSLYRVHTMTTRKTLKCNIIYMANKLHWNVVEYERENTGLMWIWHFYNVYFFLLQNTFASSIYNFPYIDVTAKFVNINLFSN